MENKYQLSRIHNYIQGLMSREEMHALEREALEDPFLADALEGYKLQQGVDTKSLSLLQQRLDRRVAAHVQQKNRFFFNGQRLAIGMAAAVLFVVGCTLLLMRHLPSHSDSTQVTEVELMEEGSQQLEVLPLPGGDAQPVEGWEVFTSYMNTHYLRDDRSTIAGQRVKVSFQVDANGQPYAIQISAEGDQRYDMDIVELLREGPKWKGKEGVISVNTF